MPEPGRLTFTPKAPTPIEDQVSVEEQRKRELRERFRDPNFLPTRQQIIETFEGDGQTNILRSFCEETEDRIFEMLSEEYLNGLADYFVQRSKQIKGGQTRPVVILEVGAGNGKLSHFLRQKLEERAPGLTTVIATDSGKWALKESFSVERINHQEALDKYHPDIVICSWMPYDVDLSEDFRKSKSVSEYVLIGEAEGGACGNDWKTWGQSWGESFDGNEVPLYKRDGFKKGNLRNLSDLQICRNDDIYHGDFNSSTVSFKRL